MSWPLQILKSDKEKGATFKSLEILPALGSFQKATPKMKGQQAVGIILGEGRDVNYLELGLCERDTYYKSRTREGTFSSTQ